MLSAFESSDAPAYRIAGNAASEFGLHNVDSTGQAPQAAAGTADAASHRQGGPPLPQDLRQCLGQLRTQCLAQLLSLFGTGPTYGAASQQLSEGLLRLAASQGLPLAAAAPWHDSSGLMELRSAAAVAVAAAKARLWGFTARAADIRVCLEGQPWAAVAASLAGLCLLLGALATSPHLHSLALHLLRPGLHAVSGYQEDQLVRAWGGHVMRSVVGFLEINPGVRHITFHLPSPLSSATKDALPSIRAAAQQSPVACRQLVLLALHPRVGRCSALQVLPLPLVHEVLQLAAPLEPCLVECSREEGAGDAE